MLAMLYIAAAAMLASCLWLLWRWDTAEPALNALLNYAPTLRQLTAAAVAMMLFMTLAMAILGSWLH
jgi:hypothetical protein